jgi:hypothetical protein
MHYNVNVFRVLISCAICIQGRYHRKYGVFDQAPSMHLLQEGIQAQGWLISFNAKSLLRVDWCINEIASYRSECFLFGFGCHHQHMMTMSG